MEQHRLRNTLEVSTNIAVLLVAIVALSAFAIHYFLKPPSLSLKPGLEKGKLVGQIPKVDYGTSPKTLLLALNTQCSHCRDSLPFYRKLVEAQHECNERLHIVALFPNKEVEVAQYVKENRLSVDTVAEVKFDSLSISGTPTLILVNNRGEVSDFWVGKLSDAEADVLVQRLSTKNF